MMSTEGTASTPPGDPPPETSWGFSGQVVRYIRTREQAEATIRFFRFIRKTIVASPRRGMTPAPIPRRITPEDSRRWAGGELSGVAGAEVLKRALEQIALDPDGRADTLLALDAHIAYLCGSFGLSEPA
jgi:hypothetical protein